MRQFRNKCLHFKTFQYNTIQPTHKALLCIRNKKNHRSRHAYVNNKPQIGTQLKSFFLFFKNIKFTTRILLKLISPQRRQKKKRKKKQKVEAISFPFCYGFVVKYCENKLPLVFKKKEKKTSIIGIVELLELMCLCNVFAVYRLLFSWFIRCQFT